jgi:hypothetical protein
MGSNGVEAGISLYFSLLTGNLGNGRKFARDCVHRHAVWVQTGHIGNSTYRRHGLHFWAERVAQRLQFSFLEIEVAQIIVHKADQPDSFLDFFQSHGLIGEHRAQIDFCGVDRCVRSM